MQLVYSNLSSIHWHKGAFLCALLCPSLPLPGVRNQRRVGLAKGTGWALRAQGMAAVPDPLSEQAEPYAYAHVLKQIRGEGLRVCGVRTQPESTNCASKMHQGLSQAHLVTSQELSAPKN